MENNRRQFERIPILLEVALSLASGRRDCRISDLSLGGCFVDSIANVTEGEKINLMLHLTTGQWLELSGEVKYVYPGIGFGLNFAEINELEKIQLEQVILDHGGQPSLKPKAPEPPQAAVVPSASAKREAGSLKNITANSISTKLTENEFADEFDQFIHDLFEETEDEKRTPLNNDLSL